MSNVTGRTIRPDGSIVDFNGKVFEKKLVKGRGVKYLAKTFTLPDVQVGGIIEYFYTIDFSENYIFDSHWILSDELFTKNAQFSLKPYKSSTSSSSFAGVGIFCLRVPSRPKKGRTTSSVWRRRISLRFRPKTTCLLPVN